MAQWKYLYLLTITIEFTKNSNDSKAMDKNPIVKHFKGLLIKLKYAYRALKAINRPHLGDVVIYKNVPCFLIQGVRAPYWDLLPLSEMDKQNSRTRWNGVHEDLFQLEPLHKRFKQSFMFTYDFYMKNWYQIEINN
jgi:hypothetical protein